MTANPLPPRPRRTRQKTTVSVSIPTEVLERLDAMAEERGYDRSAAVTLLIEDGLARAESAGGASAQEASSGGTKRRKASKPPPASGSAE